MSSGQMIVKFWGVCGSIPAPVSPARLNEMLKSAISEGMPKYPVYYGGNTTCVTIEAGGETIILDMGSGLREYGKSIMSQIFKTKEFHANIFMSHVHWDHVQGFPFFGPIYLHRNDFNVQMTLWGGVNWQEPLEAVLAGQMKHPKFPISMDMISRENAQLKYRAIHNRMETIITTNDGEIKVECRRLNHPNETYGYRITYHGHVVSFTTDNEGYSFPDPALRLLAEGADLWITDCQYTDEQYCGTGGMAHIGWGHSCPAHVITTAKLAKPLRIITFHHDPDNSPIIIERIADQVKNETSIVTMPALEGETIVIG
jgi:phosphoribosyl 1,2-cyclic phosphodiesterase